MMDQIIKHRKIFNVSYTCRDAHTGDEIQNIIMSWENRSDEEIKNNLNVWLTSVGLNFIVIEKDKNNKS